MDRANERFGADMTETAIPSLCVTCAHKRLGTAKCDAFPDGIPIDFLDGARKHTRPYRGDHGIQYEAIDGGT